MPGKPLSDFIRRRVARGVIKRNLRRAARSGKGEVPLSTETHDQIVQALKNDDYVDQVLAKSGLSQGLGDGEIIAWIQENWVEILKVLLSILPLFLI